jgi:hypothetical protein
LGAWETGEFEMRDRGEAEGRGREGAGRRDPPPLYKALYCGFKYTY